MTFNFKQFSVRQDDSALKVGTDAVLLGAAMSLDPGSDIRGLDIGTGTGVIALMAAQRLGGSFRITGIDCDGPSAAEAAFNFAASPWADRLEALDLSLEEYAKTDCGNFDFIFSNPPYYDSSLRNPDPRVSTARHFGGSPGWSGNELRPPQGGAEGLSMKDVIVFAADHLNRPKGHLALILPAESAEECRRCAASFDLTLFRRLDIRTTAAKNVRRCVLEFGFNGHWNGTAGGAGASADGLSADGNGIGRIRRAPIVETLILQNGASRTPEYSALTKDFYL